MPGRTDPIVLATVDGPWGPTRIAAGRDGLVAVAMLAGPEAFEADLRRRGFVSLGSLRDAPRGTATTLARRTQVVVAELLAGRPASADDLPIDLSDRPAWDRLVLEGVRAIPRGEVVGYGELARRIGRPGAARAVGGAVSRSPIGLVVPCHRVIAGDGTLGGYGVAPWGGHEAGLVLKQALLAIEGLEVPRSGVSRR